MKYILSDIRGERIELEDKGLCSVCEGACCKSMGCHYSLNQIKIEVSILLE